MKIPYSAESARELRKIGAKVYRTDEGTTVLALLKADGDARGVPVEPELEMQLDPDAVREEVATRREAARKARDEAKTLAAQLEAAAEDNDSLAVELEALAEDTKKPPKRPKPERDNVPGPRGLRSTAPMPKAAKK